MHIISHQGQQLGPYSTEQINQYLAQGSLDASSLVWDEHANRWTEIWQLPGVLSPPTPAGPAPQVNLTPPSTEPHRVAFSGESKEASASTNSHHKISGTLMEAFVGLTVYLFALFILAGAVYGPVNGKVSWGWRIALIIGGLVLALAGIKQLIGARRCSACNASITKYYTSCSKCKVTFEQIG